MYQRPRAKRYLGMTVNQLLVLGGLVVAICCVFAAGLGLLNYMVGTVYAPAVPADITLPTPLPSATAGPTEPPTLTPTPTSIPYELRIPQGWKQFTSPDAPGMEVWLSATYKSLTGKDKDKSSPAPLYGANVDDMKVLMVMADSKESALLLYTNAFVTVLPMRGNTLDEAIDPVFGQMMRTGRLIEKKDFELIGFPAKKLVFDINANGIDAGIVIYVFQRGRELWQFGFITPYNELFARMDEFDASARTLRLLPVTPTPTITPTVPTPTNTPLP